MGATARMWKKKYFSSTFYISFRVQTPRTLCLKECSSPDDRLGPGAVPQAQTGYDRCQGSTKGNVMLKCHFGGVSTEGMLWERAPNHPKSAFILHPCVHVLGVPMTKMDCPSPPLTVIDAGLNPESKCHVATRLKITASTKQFLKWRISNMDIDTVEVIAGAPAELPWPPRLDTRRYTSLLSSVISSTVRNSAAWPFFCFFFLCCCCWMSCLAETGRRPLRLEG